MTLNEQVTQVCHMLAQLGYRFVVAGGFARDTAAGVQPKDADIMVYQSTGLEWLPDSMFEWARLNGLDYRCLYSYGEGGSDFEERVNGVAKIGDVDIIFYQDAAHWSEIVGKFDFNINQFYIPSSIPQYSTGAHNREEPELLAYNPTFNPWDVVYAGTTPLDGLHPVRSDYSVARDSYMRAKAQMILPLLRGWVEAMQQRDEIWARHVHRPSTAMYHPYGG